MVKSVYKHGTKVALGNKGDRKIDAEIDGVAIYATHIQYHVKWWTNTGKQDLWVSESDFSVPKGIRKFKIGFNL